jgi:hypothetical protein
LKNRKNILSLTTASIFNPMPQACTMQCCVRKPRVLVLDFYITRSCQHADSVHSSWWAQRSQRHRSSCYSHRWLDKLACCNMHQRPSE